ncbi:MAG: helix-turn-helix domain-containing protein [Ruminococcaceae bacterium]|nr:helix-turn-helix domain-containing protein [Oscillospiraceae bacterium]
MPKKTQRFDPRQNMNGSSFEIFHYLDPKTRHLEAHYHDFYEIYFFIDGDVDYWIDGSLYHLVPGDILLINPTELHKPVPKSESDKYERIVLWINKTYLSGIEKGIFECCFDCKNPNYSKVLRLSSENKNSLFSLAHELCKEYYGKEFASDICAYSILLQLLTLINRFSRSDETVSNEKYSTPTLISEILAYINDHYYEKLSLDSLAAHFFINKYYLSHEFKNSVNTSLYRYITLKRLNAAYSLLCEGHPANEVSIMCGFGDYTGFFRAFKAEYGISPTECARSQRHL